MKEEIKEEEDREHVEAVPGPAIIITKEEYERMKNNNDSENQRERIKAVVSKLNIKNEDAERSI